MMDQERWELLFKAFRDESKFEDRDYVSENEFEKLNLYEWLECDGRAPSWMMKNEFALHGYDVYCIERDSFGWLVGGVREMLVPNHRTIIFG